MQYDYALLHNQIKPMLNALCRQVNDVDLKEPSSRALGETTWAWSLTSRTGYHNKALLHCIITKRVVHRRHRTVLNNPPPATVILVNLRHISTFPSLVSLSAVRIAPSLCSFISFPLSPSCVPQSFGLTPLAKLNRCLRCVFNSSTMILVRHSLRSSCLSCWCRSIQFRFEWRQVCAGLGFGLRWNCARWFIQPGEFPRTIIIDDLLFGPGPLHLPFRVIGIVSIS